MRIKIPIHPVMYQVCEYQSEDKHIPVYMLKYPKLAPAEHQINLLKLVKLRSVISE